MSLTYQLKLPVVIRPLFSFDGPDFKYFFKAILIELINAVHVSHTHTHTSVITSYTLTLAHT